MVHGSVFRQSIESEVCLGSRQTECAWFAPRFFTFYENWLSGEHLDAHLAVPHLVDFANKMGDLLDENGPHRQPGAPDRPSWIAIRSRGRAEATIVRAIRTGPSRPASAAANFGTGGIDGKRRARQRRTTAGSPGWGWSAKWLAGLWGGW